ncbi:phosphatidylglycerol:prolipoprotein diacylglycerol transferase [Butyrivibrio sp. ob235]|uniref:prolipoprotein diacylglyceryl transferase n=1 Tax=unclassified Butyrivibrio TaxID=2639466 RepID=UPI0003B57E74|nr:MULTISPECIES: prolipoprotein diacylglyceryl transferase [unclassified Butyrivibrio]SEK66594.1 phosphatidylglycerol:prolipoprotein diacylglycerol transferase [Butyrivibrio sp. ob235]
MFNDIKIGPVTLHMYGLMIAVGFLAALMIVLKRGKKKGLSEDTIYGIFYCAIIGGLLGCRLLFYIVEFPNILKNPSILWDFANGYVVYGGIIGGTLTSLIYVKTRHEEFLRYFDVVMPAVAIAQGFGRIGCFCAGCCYGAETTSPFHVVFTHSDFAPNGVQLIPTQLMSSAGDFLIGLFLIWYSGKTDVKGRTASMYLILYGVGRFIIEFFRADYRGSLGVFSTSQIISFVIVAIGAGMYALAPKLEMRF